MSVVGIVFVSLLAGGVAGMVVTFWYLEGIESRVAWLERHDKARAPKPSQDDEDFLPSEYTDWDWPVS